MWQGSRRTWVRSLGPVLLIVGWLGLWVGGRGTAAQDQTSTTPSIERELTEILETQRDAWNRGDIDAFLVPYWKSDQLTFSSGGEVRRGFEATRARYLKTYPDRKAMGQLEFSALEVTPLGTQSAMVLGNWKLTREAGPLGGNFTLVLQRFSGAWKIIHDHTSRRMD
jgi:ketosteroid isomerase-like protein